MSYETQYGIEGTATCPSCYPDCCIVYHEDLLCNQQSPSRCFRQGNRYPYIDPKRNRNILFYKKEVVWSYG